MIPSVGKPRRVLMSVDTIGGVWTYAIDLARGLGERGIEVVIAAMGAELSESQRAAAASLTTMVLADRPFKLEWMQDPWEDIRRAGDWLLDLESTYRPDVIHLNHFAHGDLPWSAPVLVVGHSCVWSWFHAVRGEEPPPCWDAYRSCVRSGLRGADAVTAPTHTMLAELRRHYGSFRSPGAIHNGRRTDSPTYRPAESFVLTAGRLWDEAKNVRGLDAAAGRIDWPVYAAGAVRSPDGGEVRLQAIRLLGSLNSEDLGEWMGRAAVYALPARYEPFGLTALEAAHAGCALVLGDIPSLREVWGDAALYAPPNDCQAIADAVNRLAGDRGLCEEMSERAARRAARYTVSRMVDSYVTLYGRLCLAAERRPSDRSSIRALSNPSISIPTSR